VPIIVVCHIVRKTSSFLPTLFHNVDRIYLSAFVEEPPNSGVKVAEARRTFVEAEEYNRLVEVF
jgi:hypothetical protein